MATERKWFIRNIAEVPWRQFPNHFGGALSKPLVMPETAGSQHIDYRISMYQPMAYVELHQHKVQEQVYHVLEGEGLMEIDGENHVVRKHDFIFLPPGVDHSIANTGLIDLVFLVVTSPVTDDVSRSTRHAILKACSRMLRLDSPPPRALRAWRGGAGGGGAAFQNMTYWNRYPASRTVVCHSRMANAIVSSSLARPRNGGVVASRS